MLINSGASNLVPGDTNGTFDVFVHDRDTATTTRVSVASDGTEANGTSDGLAISDDGRFVAFQSGATNLVPGGSGQNIYVRDRNTGTTTRISVAPGGSGPDATVDEPSISADGRFVLYRSYATNLAAGGAGTARGDGSVAECQVEHGAGVHARRLDRDLQPSGDGVEAGQRPGRDVDMAGEVHARQAVCGPPNVEPRQTDLGVGDREPAGTEGHGAVGFAAVAVDQVAVVAALARVERTVAAGVDAVVHNELPGVLSFRRRSLGSSC